MRIANTHQPHSTTIHTPNAQQATRILLILLVAALAPGGGCSSDDVEPFDGQKAFSLIERQIDFGPRTPGSHGSVEAAEWIAASLQDLSWETHIQSISYRGVELRNIIGMRGASVSGPLLLGTHFDTRPHADRDPAAGDVPVPGANDGASGVAVLLELARVLPADLGGLEVWLVFFDGEDSGQIDGWEWSAGATAFASSLKVIPQAVVIVDMVGDRDLRLPRERSSDVALADEIWGIASEQGADAFVPELGPRILDDHRPFEALGIPSVLILDLDYDYWHTAADTPDKVSGESLEQVGSVLQAWILSRR